MTLLELSGQYRAEETLLRERIALLEKLFARTDDPDARLLLSARLRVLNAMRRDMRDMAVLTARYYERGYHRSAHYTI